METIFRWLAGLLAGILERYADPALEARLDAYKAKVAAAEQKEKEAQAAERQSAIAYDESVKNRAEWEKLLTESQAKEAEIEERLRASQDRVKQINDEADALKKIIDDRSDHDVLRGDL